MQSYRILKMILIKVSSSFKSSQFFLKYDLKITRRTTGAKGNKFLQVIASFRSKDSDSK